MARLLEIMYGCKSLGVDIPYGAGTSLQNY